MNFNIIIPGTPYYMSPEQMSKSQYNEKSDIWSLGCLIYELCSLTPPFTASNQKLLAVKIKQGHFRSIPSKYSEGLKVGFFFNTFSCKLICQLVHIFMAGTVI